MLTLADLAAAAHLSVADYLGGIDWRGHKQTVDWYAVMKSRPSFRPLLAERMEVIMPPRPLRQAGFLTRPTARHPGAGRGLVETRRDFSS